MDTLLISDDSSSKKFPSALALKTDAVVKVRTLDSVQFYHKRNGGRLADQFDKIILEADMFGKKDLKGISRTISTANCDIIIITKKTADVKEIFHKGKFVTTRQECLKLL